MSEDNEQKIKLLPDQLPTGWEWAIIGDLVKVRNGYAFKSTDYKDEGVLLIRQSNLGGDKVTIENAKFLPIGFLREMEDFIVKKGDILIGMSGSIGKICTYDLDVPALQNQRTGLLVFKEDKQRRWFWHYLPLLERELVSASKGVAVLNISSKQIESFPIPIAPTAEQTRIVAEIEKQFSRLDEAVANLKRVKSNLKRYKAAILKAAVEGTLIGQDHLTWKVTSLGDVATRIRNGFSGKPDAEAGTRIFRISAVRPLRLDLDEVRYLSGEITEYSPSVVTAGDVLFTRYNGNPELVGVCAVVPETCPETVHPDKLIRVVTPKEILIPEMLALLASAGEGRSFIKSKTRTTAGQAGISGGDLKALPIRIPPLKIQHQIVAEVERRLSIVAGAEAQVDANLRRADRLRQSILKQAFSGQLVPQDPNDEPASVLLERIRNGVGANKHSPLSAMRKPKRANDDSPLRKPRQPVEPKPAASDTFACLDDVTAAILGLMQPGREYARAELADPLGLSTGRWNAAIQDLKRVGKIRQVGEKRGARYVRR